MHGNHGFSFFLDYSTYTGYGHLSIGRHIDLFAIAIGLEAWQKLLGAMFDIISPYWNIVWGFFILLGAAVFALGIGLMLRMKKR